MTTGNRTGFKKKRVVEASLFWTAKSYWVCYSLCHFANLCAFAVKRGFYPKEEEWALLRISLGMLWAPCQAF